MISFPARETCTPARRQACSRGPGPGWARANASDHRRGTRRLRPGGGAREQARWECQARQDVRNRYSRSEVARARAGSVGRGRVPRSAGVDRVVTLHAHAHHPSTHSPRARADATRCTPALAPAATNETRRRHGSFCKKTASRQPQTRRSPSTFPPRGSDHLPRGLLTRRRPQPSPQAVPA